MFFFKRCHKNKQIIEKYSNFPLKLADKKLHYGSFHGLYWKCKYTWTNGFTFPNIGPLNHIRCWAFTNVLCIKQCSGNVCNLRRSMIFIAWFNFRYFFTNIPISQAIITIQSTWNEIFACKQTHKGRENT